MKCVMLPLNVNHSVSNVLLLPLMSENAPYTGLYIGPLLNVCPGALWIGYIWIFDTLFRPPDAFCMSLYCQHEKWAILTLSTSPYPLECLNLQAQCFMTCHCASFTSQNILGLPPYSSSFPESNIPQKCETQPNLTYVCHFPVSQASEKSPKSVKRYLHTIYKWSRWMLSHTYPWKTHMHQNTG